MPKNEFFLQKKLQNRRSVRSSAPEHPLASCGWGQSTQTPALFSMQMISIQLIHPALTFLSI